MNKVKIFWSFGSPSGFQADIDDWVRKEKPNIINTSLSVSAEYSAISIVYSGSSKRELDSLLKS